MGVFCTLGVLLASTGILVGLVGGGLFAMALPFLYSEVSRLFELNLMSQYFIGYLPVDVRAADLWQIALVALGMTICATLYPAWRAARLLPSQVLAHE